MEFHRGFVDGRWSVVRVNDDGRVEVVHNGLREEAASLIAAALRDEQTDADVATGWNVVAMGAAELARRLRTVNVPVPRVQRAARSAG